MCVQYKNIYNKYAGRSIYVPCGKCEACQQEKANKRAMRIRHACSDLSLTSLFLTLTYRNTCIPYIKRSDLVDIMHSDCDIADVPIYRNSLKRKVRYSSSYDTSVSTKYGNFELERVTLLKEDIEALRNSYSKLKDVRNYHRGLISVCYYKDIQDFFKRLKQNLKRHYNYNGRLYSFQCSELGPTTGRAHFHAVVLCERDKVSEVSAACHESWPYSGQSNRATLCQLATNPSAYVASYVNRGSDFPAFFKNPAFCPKHSYSKDFGTNATYFQLPVLLANARKGVFSFNAKVYRDGEASVVPLPVPEYVVNRYFPKFKGYIRLTDDEVIKLLERPLEIWRHAYTLGYTSDDCHDFIVRIRHCSERYCKETCSNPSDYARMYVRFRNGYSSFKLRFSMEDASNVPLWERYDNFLDYVHGRVRSLYLDDAAYGCSFDVAKLNPNEYSFRVAKTGALTNLYNVKLKQRKVTNEVMSQNSCYV